MDLLAALMPGGDHPQKRDIDALASGEDDEAGSRLRAFLEALSRNAPQADRASVADAAPDASAPAQVKPELFDAVMAFFANLTDGDEVNTTTANSDAPGPAGNPVGALTIIDFPSAAEGAVVIDGLSVDAAAIALDPSASDAAAADKTQVLAPTPTQASTAMPARTLTLTPASAATADEPPAADERGEQPAAAAPLKPVAAPPAADTQKPELVSDDDRETDESESDDAALVQTVASAFPANPTRQKTNAPSAPEILSAVLADKALRRDTPGIAKADSTLARRAAHAMAATPTDIPSAPKADAPGPLVGAEPSVAPSPLDHARPPDIAVQHAANRSDAAASPGPQHAPAPADAARQVIAAIRSGPGGDAIDVRLDPPDLGRVHIRFDMNTHHAVTATVSSDRGETLDLLRRHGDSLVRELQRAGFANVQLDFAAGRNRNPSSGEFDHAPSSDAAPEVAVETRMIYLSLRDGNYLDRLV